MTVKAGMDIGERLQFICLKSCDIIRYALALGLIKRDTARLEDLRGIFPKRGVSTAST